MTVLLFETPELVEKEDWRGAAMQAALPDTAAFSACLRGTGPDSVLTRDAGIADRLGVEGTPTFWTRAGMSAGAQAVPELERMLRDAAEVGK
jgi:protein-disulfide isomerase